MAQQQQNITLRAPGFRGLNTEDSPTSISYEYASTADNCVIDQYGRIGARKGYTVLTTDNTALSTNGIEAVHEFIATDGTKVVFSCGNSKIFSGTTTLSDITPVAYTVNGDDWQIVTLNDHAYFFQTGQEPLIYEHSSTTLMPISSKTGYTATAPQGNCVSSAYGRIWTASTSSDKYTVSWSDLLQGWDWSTGTAGSMDITESWPSHDEITAIAHHNHHLIIFGYETILIYGSSATDGLIADPATDLILVDIIQGIGCPYRHTIKAVGNDLFFLDYTGVRSLGRVIQEKSLPIGDVSRNVRTDIQGVTSAETAQPHAVYSPDDSFYLLLFPTSTMAYCFDVRMPLEDGSYRTTTWSGLNFESMTKLQDGTVYFGSNDGISYYTGYQDDGAAYLMSYYTTPLTFGDPSTNKIPKQVDLTLIGGQGQTFSLFWAYNYKTDFKSQSGSIASGDVSYYGVAEYGEDEYAASATITQKKINVTGSGAALTIGFESSINGYELSVQEFNIQALVGRIL